MEHLVSVLVSKVLEGKVSGRDQAPLDLPRNKKELSKKILDPELHPSSFKADFSGAKKDKPHPAGEDLSAKIQAAPLVSLIVAAYNVEKYLSQCLDSLVNQTLRNIEIIIVNDGSTDKSLSIMEEYQARHHNVVIINSNKNIGTASARNLGFKAAKGEYLTFIDADDWVNIRFCEMMYNRGRSDNADVIIANAKIFYDDRKCFGPLYDQNIRKTLDPGLRKRSFELTQEPKILLLHPVNWTKIYKTSFLKTFAIYFEDGMSSYEDICFHFFVLIQAKRISLMDNEVLFYRDNRPGQITKMANRKVFEVFDIFYKIQEKLVKWDVSDDIWAMLVKVQLRIFNWLHQYQVKGHHKYDFFATSAQQMGCIPERCLCKFADHANSLELAEVFCFRKNRHYVYKILIRLKLLFRMFVMPLYGWGRIIKSRSRYLKNIMNAHFFSLLWRIFLKCFSDVFIKQDVKGIQNNLKQLTVALSSSLKVKSSENLPEIFIIQDQKLILSRPVNNNLVDEIGRMQNDYYLSQTAIFREGDTVVDVGAHFGVFSICLAKKYPFIKVYAVEPKPMSYSYLMRNIKLNGLTNVIAINRAITGHAKEKIFYANYCNGSEVKNDIFLTTHHDSFQPERVESSTLEQLFEEYNIEHCRLLKITTCSVINEILQSFTRKNCIDLICGEADLTDSSRVQLEIASRRIARQYFWRNVTQNTDKAVGWVHQLPMGIEPERFVEFG